MNGRYAGVSMRVYGAILPGAARLADLDAWLYLIDVNLEPEP